MKEMIKRVREEKGGFTLAELLIVVAIILVLVAVAVPVFTGAMGNAQESVAKANIHAVKSQASAQYMLQKKTGDVYYTATVDAEGNVTALTENSTGTPTEASTIKADIGNKPVQITVKITAADVSGTGGGTGTE